MVVELCEEEVYGEESLGELWWDAILVREDDERNVRKRCFDTTTADKWWTITWQHEQNRRL
jgi:hypothetical protein